MGVPALFRWLSQKYPKIISQVIEEKPVEIDGQKIPVDMAGPNPNGEEFDNLYLDMNGIVHPCSHPEDRPPPSTEEDMMVAIFEYTDRVVNMVRPRKLLMIAVGMFIAINLDYEYPQTLATLTTALSNCQRGHGKACSDLKHMLTS